MPTYEYIGKKKITINWNQYQPGDVVELESLTGLNENLFKKVKAEKPKKGGKDK